MADTRKLEEMKARLEKLFVELGQAEALRDEVRASQLRQEVARDYEQYQRLRTWCREMQQLAS
jgi:ribonuclease D